MSDELCVHSCAFACSHLPYRSNRGLLPISSRGVCDISPQKDNRLLEYQWPAHKIQIRSIRCRSRFLY